MSEQVTLSRKYQVVIPRSVREQVQLKPGQTITVMVKHGIISLVPVLSIEELQGVFAGADITGYREEADRY